MRVNCAVSFEPFKEAPYLPLNLVKLVITQHAHGRQNTSVMGVGLSAQQGGVPSRQPQALQKGILQVLCASIRLPFSLFIPKTAA